MKFSSYCEDQIVKNLKIITQGINWRCRTNFFTGASKIDILGLENNNIYIIELELRREDSVNNVVKIFYQLENYQKLFLEKHIWFIHIFSKFYEDHISKKSIAEFACKKMAKAFENVDYYSLSLNILPPKSNAHDDNILSKSDEQIVTISKAIAKLIEF